MANEKASQRHRAILEFGVLIQPLREIKHRSTPPTEADYRLAIARVRGGDSAWRTHIRKFTTFAPDVRFEQEFQDISHVPERLWQTINSLLDGLARGKDASTVHAEFITALDSAENRFLDLLAKVPVPWQPAMFEANTPFTSYLRIRALVLLVGLLTACTIVPQREELTPWQVNLYPVSGPYTGALEPIQGTVMFSRYGHGEAGFVYPDGVRCKGDYNTLFEDTYSRATATTLVLWQGLSVQNVVGSIGPNVAYGFATGVCSNGAFFECAYSVNRSSGHGIGLCRDSVGGGYKAQF